MKVLIIEDDEMTAEFIKKVLDSNKDTSDIASDGVAGLRAALEGKYDAIILDLRLPLMNGMDVCMNLRRKHITTPILILSSENDTETRVAGLDAGADDYLNKPFRYEELQARLRAITRRPSTVVQSKLQVADLSLDPASHVVRRGSETIDLRPKEYDLLEYMMRHEGTVLPKNQLLSDVWNISRYNTSNRLEACIRQLRDKVDKPYAKQLIKTVRNVGYKIAAE